MSKEFKEQLVPRNSNNLMVVDALNLAFRWKHNKKEKFVQDYIDVVESLARSYDCGKIVITADYKGSDYRSAILPSYKLNRKEKYANQTEEEKAEADAFFEEFERTLVLISTKYPVLRYKGVEADDLAAWIVSNNSTEHIWLISSDKDWDLLVSDKVSRFSYVTRKEITTMNWEEHYPYPVDAHLSIKCLTGDSGDNIPGIPGVGPVRAANLISSYGTAFEVHANCPIDSKYKFIHSLNEHCGLIIINYELMDLISFHEDAIGPDNLEQLKKVYTEYMS